MARWRTLVASTTMLLGLVVYIIAVLWLADWIGEMPIAVAILFYVATGLAWIWALRPLFRWAGRDRVPDNWGARQ